jgi:hypothetical protein
LFIFYLLGASYRLLSFCLRFLGCIGENGLKLKIKSLHYDFTNAATFLPPSISITGLEAGYVWRRAHGVISPLSSCVYIYIHVYTWNQCMQYVSTIHMYMYIYNIQTDLQYMYVYMYIYLYTYKYTSTYYGRFVYKYICLICIHKYIKLIMIEP